MIASLFVYWLQVNIILAAQQQTSPNIRVAPTMVIAALKRVKMMAFFTAEQDLLPT
jgi:hypothetical protein